MTDIAARIRLIVAEQLGQDEAIVTDVAELVDDLGADSLDVVEIAITLEDELDIEIDDHAIEGWKTVGQIARWAEARTVRESGA